MYHFAVAVLEDRFDDAERLMRTEAVQSKISEQHFKEWPLLRDFRKTEGFQQAFKEIFKKDFADEILQKAKEELEAQQSADLLLEMPELKAASEESANNQSPE